ncbi:sensor histidine kinase [Pectinatus brassicae]|uniref:histidine kinase n=1 Tax=Pectinatus brassicae TaxID=862415 RepID=A0A840USJ7_9FIRM|nr:HAMP domain-containing sensor histidine kinase [Pectinatus brassicae]MBB5337112.1 signal transduction histidine kinase [Pectinatus brassicae]
MTIKKRLFISNVLMNIIPIISMIIISILCIEFIWITTLKNDPINVNISPSFYNESHRLSELAEVYLNTTDKDKKTQINQEINRLLSRNDLSLTIDLSNKEKYHFGSTKELDNDKILKAKALLPVIGIISSEDFNYYSNQIKVNNALYNITILGEKIKRPSSIKQKLEESPGLQHKVFIPLVIVLFMGIFFSMLITNKLLNKFILKKLEKPITTLLDGVEEIRNGNLNYRINYNSSDEFALVCKAFNDMAVRLKSSAEFMKREESNRKELLAGISHDLRSPLTSIRAYVEGLLDGVAKTPAMQEKYLKKINKKSIEIDKMVSDIFLFSKIDIGGYLNQFEYLNVKKEINTLINDIKTEYQKKGLVINSHDIIPAIIFGNPVLLRRVFINIIENSLKYKQKETGELDIFSLRENENIILVFSDDGPGVPEESLPKIFEIFYKSDPARQNPQSSSGLGLSIVLKAIEQMGGSITAENGLENGLVIKIKLPIQENEHE